MLIVYRTRRLQLSIPFRLNCTCCCPSTSIYNNYLSYDCCQEDKMEYYQNCSVLYCVVCTTTIRPTQLYAHSYEQFLQVV